MNHWLSIVRLGTDGERSCSRFMLSEAAKYLKVIRNLLRFDGGSLQKNQQKNEIMVQAKLL
jgi:hypothetical protein